MPLWRLQDLPRIKSVREQTEFATEHIYNTETEY